MSLVWPTDLDKPMREGFRLTAGDARRWFEAEAGPPAVGLDITSVPDQVALQLHCSANQAAVFWDFWKVKTRNGVRAFAMPDPLNDGWALPLADGTVLTLADGTPILLSRTWLCQFGKQPPSETVVGVDRRITCEVWVMP